MGLRSRFLKGWNGFGCASVLVWDGVSLCLCHFCVVGFGVTLGGVEWVKRVCDISIREDRVVSIGVKWPRAQIFTAELSQIFYLFFGSDIKP